ncbi:unnamed protein product [Phaeothamnion confervicola]
MGPLHFANGFINHEAVLGLLRIVKGGDKVVNDIYDAGKAAGYAELSEDFREERLGQTMIDNPTISLRTVEAFRGLETGRTFNKLGLLPSSSTISKYMCRIYTAYVAKCPWTFFGRDAERQVLEPPGDREDDGANDDTDPSEGPEIIGFLADPLPMIQECCKASGIFEGTVATDSFQHPIQIAITGDGYCNTHFGPNGVNIGFKLVDPRMHVPGPNYGKFQHKCHVVNTGFYFGKDKAEFIRVFFGGNWRFWREVLGNDGVMEFDVDGRTIHVKFDVIIVADAKFQWQVVGEGGGAASTLEFCHFCTCNNSCRGATPATLPCTACAATAAKCFHHAVLSPEHLAALQTARREVTAGMTTAQLEAPQGEPRFMGNEQLAQSLARAGKRVPESRCNRLSALEELWKDEPSLCGPARMKPEELAKTQGGCKKVQKALADRGIPAASATPAVLTALAQKCLEQEHLLVRIDADLARYKARERKLQEGVSCFDAFSDHVCPDVLHAVLRGMEHIFMLAATEGAVGGPGGQRTGKAAEDWVAECRNRLNEETLGTRVRPSRMGERIRTALKGGLLNVSLSGSAGDVCKVFEALCGYINFINLAAGGDGTGAFGAPPDAARWEVDMTERLTPAQDHFFGNDRRGREKLLMFRLYAASMRFLRQQKDFTEQEVQLLGRLSDFSRDCFLGIWSGNQVSNYEHILFSGHWTWAARRFKCPFRMCQESLESWQGTLKSYFHHKTMRGGCGRSEVHDMAKCVSRHNAVACGMVGQLAAEAVADRVRRSPKARNLCGAPEGFRLKK